MRFFFCGFYLAVCKWSSLLPYTGLRCELIGISNWSHIYKQLNLIYKLSFFQKGYDSLNYRLCARKPKVFKLNPLFDALFDETFNESFTLSISPQCIDNHVWCFPTNLKQLFKLVCPILSFVKGIVHPKMKMLCFSAYPEGIQYVCDFVSSVEHKLKFLTQTVADCQSYNVTQWYSWLWEKKQAYTDQTKLNPAARDDTLRSKDTKRSCKKQNSIYIIILCAL